MTAPLMNAVTDILARSGLHVLRFNFRGVGRSGGGWGKGESEVSDVAAAVEAASAAFPDLPLGIGGWSFGATTSLRWQVSSRSALPWVGIAPGIRKYRGSRAPEVAELLPARRLIILGDRDQFASVEEMNAFADSFGCELDVLSGSDHFFYFREERVAEAMIAAL